MFLTTKKMKIKKLSFLTCDKYKKFEKPKISYIFVKTIVISIICSKCKNEDAKIFKQSMEKNQRIKKWRIKAFFAGFQSSMETFLS